MQAAPHRWLTHTAPNPAVGWFLALHQLATFPHLQSNNKCDQPGAQKEYENRANMRMLPPNTLSPPPCTFVVQFPQIRLVFAFNSPQWFFFPSLNSLTPKSNANSSCKHTTSSVFSLRRLSWFLPDGASSLTTDARCQFYPSSRLHGDLSSWSHTCTCIWLLDLSAVS